MAPAAVRCDCTCSLLGVHSSVRSRCGKLSSRLACSLASAAYLALLPVDIEVHIEKPPHWSSVDVCRVDGVANERGGLKVRLKSSQENGSCGCGRFAEWIRLPAPSCSIHQHTTSAVVVASRDTG